MSLARYDSVSDNWSLHVISLLTFTDQTVAGTILEAPSKKFEITSSTQAEILDSVPMMFAVSRKSQETLQYLNPSAWMRILFNLLHWFVSVANIANTDLLALNLIARVEGNLYLPPTTANALVTFWWDWPDRALNIRACVAIYRQILLTKHLRWLDTPFFLSSLTSRLTRLLMVSRSEIAQLYLHFPVLRSPWLESLAHAVMGHSLGEISTAGMFTSQFWRVIVHRFN